MHSSICFSKEEKRSVMAANLQELSNPTQNQMAAQHFCELACDCGRNDGKVAIVSIDDAIRLLNEAATQVAGGSMAVWKIVDHARGHQQALGVVLHGDDAIGMSGDQR
jgi:hypothetical protein